MLHQPLALDVSADLFSNAIKRASTQQLALTELIECAEKLKMLKQTHRVVELYKTWIAYNPDDALLYAVYFNYGVILAEVPDLAGAINALREAIRLKPDFYPPYINLDGILEGLGQTERAVGEWMRLVTRLPDINGDSVSYKCLGLKQIGRVLEGTNNDKAAEDALRQSLEINTEQTDVIQHWISLRQRQCKWPVITESAQIKKSKLLSAISPLSIACYADDPIFQLANALHYNKKSIGLPLTSRTSGGAAAPNRSASDRLRIGYVSSDLREHAVGFSMTDVVETHNRENVEIFAYYCGVPGSDATQVRIKNGVDHWFDFNGLDDGQAALKIKSDRIDILVDLNGYTKDARTKVFAMRPAPISVNWFGFPSSMGSPYHHYIVADSFVIPEDHELYYSEKVVRLPCYQPNDRKRVVATRAPSRQDERLPDAAFVYCCLNGMQKLNSLTFQRWMTILHNVPNSVLWLLTGTSETNERLRQAAAQHGIDINRLIFADKKANPEHLARYPLADLFLDTLPYGAHTTAADAIWMGTTILTLPGRSFASRVCSSLVRAAGIGELICATPDEYVRRAIEYGQDGKKLTPLKQRLIEGRNSCLLFDTPKLVQSLENLYRGMWNDFLRGKLPIPDLSNLDVYHEIGVEQDLETIELLTDEAYRALYQQGLAARHEVYPIRLDERLWRRQI
jgi:predicted O-linked N-acetylglucosamine transferase (SPINDLY family)